MTTQHPSPNIQGGVSSSHCSAARSLRGRSRRAPRWRAKRAASAATPRCLASVSSFPARPLHSGFAPRRSSMGCGSSVMSRGRRSRSNGDGGQDRVEGLAELAANLAGRNVDVLVTGGTAAAKALKSATGTIPIVMAIVGDPVAAGLVDSLARPGGNATGFSIVAPDLSGKRLELLKEIVPGISRVAVMLNARNPQSQFELREMQAAAQAMGLQLQPVQISSQDALEEAFAAMSRASAHALKIGRASCRERV